MARKRKTENIALARVLRNIADERGLTLKQLAAMAEVRVSVIQSWMEGRVPHELLAVKKLAKVLGVSFEHLLFGHVETEVLHIEEHYNESEIFEGLCKVRLMRLTPKRGGK